MKPVIHQVYTFHHSTLVIQQRFDNEHLADFYLEITFHGTNGTNTACLKCRDAYEVYKAFLQESRFTTAIRDGIKDDQRK